MWVFYCFFFNSVTLRDTSIISRALTSLELPHADVRPESIAYWINRIESYTGRFVVSGMQEFISQFPDIQKLPASEQYLLYCYFYCRCFRKISTQPSSTSSISLKATPMKRSHDYSTQGVWVESPTLSRRSVTQGVWVESPASSRRSVTNEFPTTDLDVKGITNRIIVLPEVDEEVEFVDFEQVVPANYYDDNNNYQSGGERRYTVVKQASIEQHVSDGEQTRKTLINKDDRLIERNNSPWYTEDSQRILSHSEYTRGDVVNTQTVVHVGCENVKTYRQSLKH